ncbi:MAG TPA: DUF1194 domain-containing protein, partial [Stellaceae bacterium]|nr:DUF1194 domain-containing protein [Stellaceae bacterium]
GAAFDRMPEPAVHRVIDISGDGMANFGASPVEARDALVGQGITINGLAILNEGANIFGFSGHTQPPGGLPKWYHDNVTGGPGSFLLTVEDFESFGEAMTKKLLNEIAMTRPPFDLAQRAASASPYPLR